MQTFFIDENAVNGRELIPDAEVCHHISHVLRMRVGDAVRFSDHKAHYYEGKIASVTKQTVKVTVEQVKLIDDEPKTDVTLIQCLPRGDKMEHILQKATELGVNRIIPVESENSQVRLKDKKTEKQERWQKVVSAAAEQCGRGVIPMVQKPCTLQAALSSLRDDAAVVFCYEKEERASLGKTLSEIKTQTSKVALVIGPEGGFTDAEAKYLIKHGAHCVTLGKRILRTETAGPAVLAVLMYEFDEWEVKD